MLIAFALALLGLLGYGAFELDWDESTFITAAFVAGALLLTVGFLTRPAARR